MRIAVGMTIMLLLHASRGTAQDFGYANHDSVVYDSVVSPIPSACEPLYEYDDLDVWKHGWIPIHPHEHGYHCYRPYNYKQVFAQAAQSSMWGMPSTTPYSQSYYLRYGPLTGINGERISAGASDVPSPGYYAPHDGDPSYRDPVPTSMDPTPPPWPQPFDRNQTPQQFNHLPGPAQRTGQ